MSGRPFTPHEDAALAAAGFLVGISTATLRAGQGLLVTVWSSGRWETYDTRTSVVLAAGEAERNPLVAARLAHEAAEREIAGRVEP